MAEAASEEPVTWPPGLSISSTVAVTAGCASAAAASARMLSYEVMPHRSSSQEAYAMSGPKTLITATLPTTRAFPRSRR